MTAARALKGGYMATKYGSYTGKVIKIDLTTRTWAEYPVNDEDRRLFLGGKILAARILNDFITMGQLIAYDALNRNESCGGHFREEYQTEDGEAKRDDANCFYVSCWEYQGSDEKAPVMYKEPLKYEAIEVKTRNYKN